MRGCLSRRSGSSALIAYEDQKGENRVEVLTFRNSLVTERPRHIRRKLARPMRLQAPSGLRRMSTDPNADPYDEAIASLEKLPSRISDACGLDSHLPHQCARLAQRKSAAPTKQRSRYRNSRCAPSRRP